MRISKSTIVIMLIGFMLLSALSVRMLQAEETAPDAAQASEEEFGMSFETGIRSGIEPLPKNVKAAVDAVIPPEYGKMAENEHLILYLNDTNLGIKVKDKASGYVWSSVIDQPEDEENNAAWTNFMMSGVSVEYFEKGKSALKRAELLSEKDRDIRVQSVDGGFQADIGLVRLGFELSLNVRLEGEDVIIGIPNESIREGGNFKLASIYTYPFLGATRKGDVPGYMFIPDGSGALIRLQDNKNNYKIPYEERIYGDNDAIDSASIRDKWNVPPNKISFPVFGMVHGIDQNGLFGIIEEGKYNAKLLAYPNGVNSQYNWVTAKYIYRESYLQPTSRTLGGIVIFEKDRNNGNLKTRYRFLRGKDANYAGMAKTYRDYLAGRGDLKRAGMPENRQIPVRIDVLGAETENGLFTKNKIKMTTVDQFRSMIGELKTEGIDSMLLIFKGWNKGGLSGTNPSAVSFDKSLGSAAEFRAWIAQLEQTGTPLYFHRDYTVAYDESTRFSARADAAKRVDKTVLELRTLKDVYEKIYYMSGSKAERVVADDIRSFPEQDISRIAVENTGNILFSELEKQKVRSRSGTAEIYSSLMERLNDSLQAVAMYAPHDYMLPYTDRYLDVPMYSSQRIFETDTVPFVQMVLKGYMDYYAPYSNFFANGQEELLRLIEFGAYPSYYMTHEPSYKLKFTNSSDLYTSTFREWKQDIADSYRILNEALGPVSGATMESREVLARNVVKVSYSNGVDIYVNYTENDYDKNGITVPGKGFRVIEVNR